MIDEMTNYVLLVGDDGMTGRKTFVRVNLSVVNSLPLTLLVINFLFC